ncbi:MAG: Clp protease ClpP [Tidjanibacter sp.]|nr:Clp protease ClpP [Tidjanibacter sp.]
MNTTKNKIASSLRIATIDIDGILGTPEQEQFGTLDARVATYERFEEALAEIREEGEIDRLVLNIRSTGGCLADALLIYDTVRSLGVEVVTRCYGYVASAATIIAQAASKGCREISANALYLIHCCESAVEGNTHSLSATKELLDKSDERLAEIYALASGRTPEEYRELMNRNSGKGVWLSPEECVKAGLADSIIASSPITDSARGQIFALGLTPLPAKSLGERIREAWGQLLSQVGLGGEETSAIAQAPVDVSASKAEDRVAGEPPVPPSRLHTARPTLTKECDDPAPNGTHSLTANQAAYESDVAELKRVMSK